MSGMTKWIPALGLRPSAGMTRGGPLSSLARSGTLRSPGIHFVARKDGVVWAQAAGHQNTVCKHLVSISSGFEDLGRRSSIEDQSVQLVHEDRRGDEQRTQGLKDERYTG